MVQQNLSMLFYLKEKRQDKKGYCLIYARITIDGIREEFSTKCKVLPVQWDKKRKKCSGNTTLAQTTNTKLSQIKTSVERIFLLLSMDNKRVTSKMVIEKLFPEKLNSENSTGELKFYNLSVQVEKVYESIVDYQKELNKAEKIKNQFIRIEREKTITKLKVEIKDSIERLVKETNRALSENRLEKHLMNAVYEFMLYFSRHVMGGQRSYNTLRKWHYTKEKIKAFCWYHYRKNKMLLEEIPYSFAQNFYDYLTLVDHCGHNLAMKYIKNTKQILDRITDHSWINKNPINGFQCNYIDPEREPVGMDDIIKIINAEFNGMLDMVRDAFLFSIFTGFAYEDTRRLEQQDIFKGIDGKLWIGSDRIKTGTGEKVPLLPLPLQIIDKYKEHPCRIFDEKLLPIFSNQTYNKRLKEIAVKCNILIDLTTHIARHTFATVITLENDVPLATVKGLMGHKTIRATEKYAKATQKKISRNMMLLENKLFTENGDLIGMNNKNILNLSLREISKKE